METGVRKSSVHYSLKKRAIVCCKNTLKPLLTVETKIEQMKFILVIIRDIPKETRNIFDNMLSMVHKKRKRNYLRKDSQRAYLIRYEDKSDHISKR